MADKDQDDAGARAKSSRLPLVLGVGLALAGGGGGFYAVYSGHILAPDSAAHAAIAADRASARGGTPTEMPDIEYVPIEALVISLGDGATGAHLRFRAQLEVARKYRGEVETLMPRVVDVLNSYLRALEADDLADNTALVRLRSQMLRRIQIVTGAGRVNDLLIMEFVLN